MPTATSATAVTGWAVWHMLDSNLPTGGFAHSYGLEAVVQLGQCRLQQQGSDTTTTTKGEDGEEARIAGLLAFIRQAVRQQAVLLLPMVRAAYTAAAAAADQDTTSASAAAAPDALVPAWAALDHQCHALVTTEGGRRASIAQGQALLRLACDTFPTISPWHRQQLRAARDQVRGRHTAAENTTYQHPPSIVPAKGHHAPLFGWLCCALGVDLETTARMFLYLVLRDLMAAATRLGLVGPLLAVRLQMSLYQDAEVIASEVEGGAGGATPRQDNPLLDILQGAHEKLYSRLFIS